METQKIIRLASILVGNGNIGGDEICDILKNYFQLSEEEAEQAWRIALANKKNKEDKS